MDTYSVIQNHKSVRNYLPDAIPSQDLKKILESAIKAPSSINGQQWSVIVVKDENLRKELSVLCGNQPYVASAPIFLVFVMDYHKIAYQMEKMNIPFEHGKTIEAIMVGSVDVGLAFSNAMNVAESMGYGTVAIGGIRNNADKVSDLLKLPKYVYPVLGMCLGLPASEHEVKPRMPYEAVVFENEYSLNPEVLDEYDRTVEEYLRNRSSSNKSSTWSAGVAKFYQRVYAPNASAFLEKQGFTKES